MGITIEDVAREAGVSRALVSIAFRGVDGVSAATSERIFQAARKLGYRPNRNAVRLASKTSNALGVFLQDIRNDVFADIHDGLREAAGQGPRQLLLVVGTPDGLSDARSLETLLELRVDAIIAAGLILPDAEAIALAAHVPLVSIAREIPGVDSVVSDNRAGACAATAHLLELGHRRIVFLSNPQTDGYLDRRRGYIATMESAGLPPTVIPSSYSRSQAALDIVPALDSRERPTAVFAHNDQAALGVLDAMAERGLTPGRDVSVVGYDNSTVSSSPGTRLTSVDLHGAGLGRSAVDVAELRLIEPTQDPILRRSTPTLVVRGTTGPT